VPMFLFKRNGRAVANTGQTFRLFMKSGFEGHQATAADWKLHLNTLFPEVRLKNTIEIRGADMQSTDMACALPALWTGVLYDDQALGEAEALIDGWTYEEVAELRTRAWRDGLRAGFRGRPLADVAARLVAIADGGLERRGFLSPSGKDERVHLARLLQLVGEAKTPADVLLEGMDRESDPAAAIVERSTLRWSHD
jgi:glutamate--cysteine ligase